MKKLFILIILFSAKVALAQTDLCPKTENKKAQKYFDQAVDESKKGRDYKKIQDYVSKSTEEDTGFAAPYKLLGDIAYRRDDFKTMHTAYERALEICPDAGAELYYRLGNYYYGLKKIEEAQKYFKGYKEQGSNNEKMDAVVELKLFRCKLMLNPVPFDPVQVKQISTADPEYLPFISPDNDLCFFTRRFDENSKGSLVARNVEKFMIAHRLQNGEFDKGEPMPYPFNKSVSGNEGGASISIDNLHLYFTVNDKGNFDICQSDWNGKEWSEITKLPPAINHPRQWDAQPCISPDGKTLYFTTYRDSINQTSDIYYSTKNTDGTWAKALPLKQVNTTGNEKSPFMHPDNRTFYFSSDSLPGMGGYDIFVCRIDEKGNWSKPVNIGYPINTEGDEVGFFVSTDGKTGYFASNELKNVSGYDIFSFDIPEKVKPDRVLFIKGDLKNDSNEVLLEANIELKNIRTKEIMNLSYDTVTGRYAQVILFNNDYIMTVKKQGYAFNSQYFSKTDTLNNTPREVDFNMKNIEVGMSYQLNHILFKTNSAVLDSTSLNVIDDFTTFLNENPTVRVSINGHTDNEGSASENLTLSNNRAKTVYDNLIKNGIAASRLMYKGFGQSKPVAGNDTEDGKRQNRRTEFVIISK
ncbi:MAG: OmpA family protein [Bacteroidia bacterium]